MNRALLVIPRFFFKTARKAMSRASAALDKELQRLQGRIPAASSEPSRSSIAERLRHKGEGDDGSHTSQEEEDQKMAVARQVIAEMRFEALKPEPKVVVVDDPEAVRRERIQRERLAHTQQMMASPRNRALYSMKKERRTLTYRALMDVMDAVYRQAAIPKTDLPKLVALFRERLKVCIKTYCAPHPPLPSLTPPSVFPLLCSGACLDATSTSASAPTPTRRR